MRSPRWRKIRLSFNFHLNCVFPERNIPPGLLSPRSNRKQDLVQWLFGVIVKGAPPPSTPWFPDCCSLTLGEVLAAGWRDHYIPRESTPPCQILGLPRQLYLCLPQAIPQPCQATSFWEGRLCSNSPVTDRTFGKSECWWRAGAGKANLHLEQISVWHQFWPRVDGKGPMSSTCYHVSGSSLRNGAISRSQCWWDASFGRSQICLGERKGTFCMCVWFPSLSHAHCVHRPVLVRETDRFAWGGAFCHLIIVMGWTSQRS